MKFSIRFGNANLRHAEEAVCPQWAERDGKLALGGKRSFESALRLSHGGRIAGLGFAAL